jgi:hypothetical protein
MRGRRRKGAVVDQRWPAKAALLQQRVERVRIAFGPGVPELPEQRRFDVEQAAAIGDE